MITVKPIIEKRKKSIFDFRFSKSDSKDEDLYKDSLNLETGDLVFVSYNNFLGYFIRGYLGSAWTHVGMIMKYEDKLYVMETADYRSVKNYEEKKKNGLLVIPLETWKSLNKKHTIVHKQLQTPEDFDRRILIREFLKIQEANLDTFSVGINVWSKYLWRRKYRKSSNLNQERSNITCSELIAKIYHASAVIKKVYDPGSYYTKDFIENNIEMEPGFKLI